MTSAPLWRSHFVYELYDTNAWAVVEYRRRFPNRRPPGASTAANARRANQFHATPTDDQQFSRLHCIRRLIDGQTKVPFVYKGS